MQHKSTRRTKSTLLIALAYVVKHPHRYLFPLAPGRKNRPCIKDNLAQASNDPKQLKAWAKEFGDDCGWACAAKKSRLICVDIDAGPNKKGLESYRALRAAGMCLPATETQRSPSGGFHLIYKGAHHFSASKIGMHIDTPNYFVIAGCKRSDGKAYELYRDVPAAYSPAWLAEEIKPRADRPRRERNTDAVPLDWFKRALQATPYIGGPEGLDNRHEYEGWLSFAMACHEAAGGDEADYLDAFISWSLDDPNCKESWTAESIERHWQSFTADPPPGMAAITRASWLKLLAGIGCADLVGELMARDDFLSDPYTPTKAESAEFKKWARIEQARRARRLRDTTVPSLLKD